MEENKKQYTSALTIDRAAFLLLRVKKAFKKKKLQRKEREKSSAQFLSTCNRIDQRASCAGLESSGRTGSRKPPPPLLRSRTLPAIVVPGVSILQAQLGNCTPQLTKELMMAPLDHKLSGPAPSSSTSKDDSSMMSFADFRRQSAASRLCSGSNYGPERGADGTLVLRVPAPHVVAARAYRMQTSNTPLNRLSKLLNANNSTNKNQMAIADDSNVIRRLSWERRDPALSRLPRSSSIDSMVDTIWSESENHPQSDESSNSLFLHPSSSEKRQSLIRTELLRPATLVSPSVGRRMKGQRGINELPTLPVGGSRGGSVSDLRNNPQTSSEMDSLLGGSSSSSTIHHHNHHHHPPIDSVNFNGGNSDKCATLNDLPPNGSSSGHHHHHHNHHHHHHDNINNNNHKPTKKEAKLMQQRLEKLAKAVNIHLHALFAAVEHGHLDKARTILESTDVDVNSLNSDRLSPLDVAVLSNNRPMVKMLIGFGAREGTRESSENLGYHLKKLLEEAELRIQDFGGLWDESGGTPVNSRASFSSIIGSTNPGSAMTGCAGGDTEKQAIAWCKRAKTLKRLILGFNQVRPPDPPSLVAIDITSENSIALRLQVPTLQESPITTKFKVQWSTKSDFSLISSEKEICDISSAKCTNCGVDFLTKGRRYYFRVACGNLKGWGAYQNSQPPSVVPSSWRQLEGRTDRYDQSNASKLDRLVEEVKELRPGSDIFDHFGNHNPVSRRTQRKKTTIKQLFTAASKFQKNLRRGIYLACILYHEDKVLVTNEDFLPVIEIDELFPSNIQADLFWLMKISCNWENTKCLKSDMEKNSSSKIHFRLKLLSAILQMQQSLNLNDLGQIFYRTLKDFNSSSTLIISTINYLKSPKNVSVLNSKWLPLNKIYKIKINLSSENQIGEVLMSSIQEQIAYHQNSNVKLGKGLYLAYLKMQSSMDLIQVVVPTNSPNMLPHCKIRDNPHVSAEEWEFLQRLHLPDLTITKPNPNADSQSAFLDLIISASKRLFNYMGINLDEAKSYRLYDREIIEITPEISFMIICPSVEFSCSVPGQREILLQRGDFISLPLQIFEMIHLQTYQRELIEKYSQLSYLLELDSDNANHLQREAFSNSELKSAKEKIQKLQDLQTKLGQIWKNLRWLMDVVTFSRDRLTPGIPLRSILKSDIDGANPVIIANTKRNNLLEIPTKILNKSSPGRGSWPGPESTLSENPILLSEFSKSEQHLSDINTILSDSDSIVSDFSRLVPSRSEDTLFNVAGASEPYRARAQTVSATTSPLLNVSKSGFSGSLVSVNTGTSGSLHSLSSDGDAFDNSVEPGENCAKISKNLSKSLTNFQKEVPVGNKGLSKSDGNNSSGILQVFAAYDTGLASGTSLKLHVTGKTTAREVVDLVVKQLNMAVVLKGKEGPIYPAEKLKSFCLVAVIGARERCLRDDFKPLQLQNPWKKGRLYVRLKNDVLAALEHSSKHQSQII